MGKILNTVTDFVGLTDSEAAGKAASAATGQQVAAQREALDYLKEVEKLPQQFREGALMKLAGISGIEGGEGDQQALIDRAKQSPLYAEIMGTRDAGEEAIMRNAAMTGGLRSGNVQDEMFTADVNLQNQALNQSFNQQLQGLQGLAQLPSNANNIATATSGIGTTQAEGTMARTNADLAALQGGTSNLMKIGAMAFSDRRLKKNVELVGKVDGYNWYSWDWNKLANDIGLEGSSQGVLADEIVDLQRNAVSFRSGYMIIDYGKLEVRHAERV